MIGTILCAVNDTPGAGAALAVAARLSRRLEMRLVVVHVVEEAALSPAARADAWAGGMRLVDHALAEHGAAFGDRRVVIGDPASEIAQIAREERPELIVVGSKLNGRRWRPPLRSRVATELARISEFPVLVTPPDLLGSQPRQNGAARANRMGAAPEGAVSGRGRA